MRRYFTSSVDLAILALATAAALLLRENLVYSADKFEKLLPYLAATLIIGCFTIPMTGLHCRPWRYTSINDVVRTLLFCLITVVAATITMFVVNRLDGIARSTPILQFLLAFVGLMGVRVLARLWYVQRAPGKPFTTVSEARPQNVLLVGLTGLAHIYARAVKEFGDGQVNIAGIVDHAATDNGMRLSSYPVFGANTRLPELLNKLSVQGIEVDKIVLTISRVRLPPQLQVDLNLVASAGLISIVSAPDILQGIGWGGPGQDQRPIALKAGQGERAFTLSAEEVRLISCRPYWRIKRTADAVLAATLMILLAPLAALVTLAVYFDVGGPVLFWQQRPGVAGRPFRLVKFRTMSDKSDLIGSTFKDSNRDAGDYLRSSAIGRFLRTTRLDEIPQLWNILIGQMSFIGPRPLLPADQSADYSARLLVRPGLTGWAQVKGGRHITAADKAALDVWYLLRATFTLDAQIIRLTVLTALRGEKIDSDAISVAWADLRRSGICRPHRFADAPAPAGRSGLLAADSDGQSSAINDLVA